MEQLALLGGPPVRTDPFPVWPTYGDEERRGLEEVLTSRIWSNADGPKKQDLERRFAAFHDADHAIAMSNGSVTLEVALRACRIGAGDEVIVPAYTFVTTATAVLQVNALPIFVDICATTYNIAPEAVEAAITSRTRAIICVHFAGQPCDMERLTAIATRHSVPLIEDAAQAHGAVWRSRHVGALGDFGSWSFQSSKNMTAGEGGMLTTNDALLADRARALHNCGRTFNGKWFEHGLAGGNYRLSEWQCAVLLAQLDRLPRMIAARELAASYLNDRLSAVPGIRPLSRSPDTTTHAYHLYMFRYESGAFDGLSREKFVNALRGEGIPASAGYPRPLNMQPVFVNRAFDVRATGYDPNYAPTQFERLHVPATARACAETVWLPQNALLGNESDLDDIVSAVGKVHQCAAALRRATTAIA